LPGAKTPCFADISSVFSELILSVSLFFSLAGENEGIFIYSSSTAFSSGLAAVRYASLKA
jgi:hypothetical protein